MTDGKEDFRICVCLVVIGDVLVDKKDVKDHIGNTFDSRCASDDIMYGF